MALGASSPIPISSVSTSSTTSMHTAANQINIFVCQEAKVLASSEEKRRKFVCWIRVIGFINFGLLRLIVSLGDSIVDSALPFGRQNFWIGFRLTAPTAAETTMGRAKIEIKFGSKKIASYDGPSFNISATKAKPALRNDATVLFSTPDGLFLAMKNSTPILSAVPMPLKLHQGDDGTFIKKGERLELYRKSEGSGCNIKILQLQSVDPRYTDTGVYEDTPSNVSVNNTTFYEGEVVKECTQKIQEGKYDHDALSFRIKQVLARLPYVLRTSCRCIPERTIGSMYRRTQSRGVCGPRGATRHIAGPRIVADVRDPREPGTIYLPNPQLPPWADRHRQTRPQSLGC
ncbi:unnamed protein product, partial [Mesorhabditis spiculigera]